jgi:dTMP kinase
MRKGTYIVIEGLDGSGKTTQFARLHDHLGHDKTHAVREPGGTPMSEKIRSLLKDPKLPRSAHTNMFLFSAARTDLIDRVVRPTLLSGKHVLSDRNWLSMLAYQAAEGAEADYLLHLSKIATGDLFEPDITIFIDVDPAICRKRLQTKGESHTDFFDKKGVGYFKKVRQVYLRQIKQLPRAYSVDGSVTPNEVWQQIQAIVKNAGL